jgi:hypothetical protein
MHTGDRSADAIDAGLILPGYQGIIVRDGYNVTAAFGRAAGNRLGARRRSLDRRRSAPRG